MKLFTTLALAACLALMATTAFGAARDVRPGLVQGDNPEIVTVFEIKQAEATVSGYCLNLTGLPTTDGVACDALATNQYVVPRSFKVTNLRTTVGLPGDTAWSCNVQIEVGATAVGTLQEWAITQAAGVVMNTPQKLVVLEGSLLGIMLADGTACGGGSADPSYTVQLEGYFLDTPVVTDSYTKPVN